MVALTTFFIVSSFDPYNSVSCGLLMFSGFLCVC